MINEILQEIMIKEVHQFIFSITQDFSLIFKLFKKMYA